MSDANDDFGSGILKGLKKVLFHSDASSEKNTPVTQVAMPAPQSEPSLSKVEGPAHQGEVEGTRDMKLKVYQLLENLNKPGIDFFEVWNAAVEMGGANSTNIKSAFTSLKYADKSLSKSRLLESGAAYISGLSSVIETESKKRLEEKNRLDREMEEVKTSLDNEINSIEQQISSLQQKLSEKRSERENIHAKYQPRIIDIDNKITSGRQSVNSVLSEMQQVLDIIKKDLN